MFQFLCVVTESSHRNYKSQRCFSFFVLLQLCSFIINISTKVLVSLCCYTGILTRIHGIINLFQFLCVVTNIGVKTFLKKKVCFSFFVLLLMPCPNPLKKSWFQFLCVVTSHLMNQELLDFLVLVSLCCYNFIKGSKQNLNCFSFFVLLQRDQPGYNVSVCGVLVSLCCYFSVMSSKRAISVFQFLCVVTRSKDKKSFKFVMFQFLCVVT